MDAWIEFWKYACLIGFGCFYLLALAIIPLGARDLRRLFRRLAEGSDRQDDSETTP